MAAMTLPIQDLESLVRKEAKPKATCVANISKSNGEGLVTVCKIAMLTMTLKFVLKTIVRRQGRIIERLQEQDFSACSRESIEELALSIDQLVSDERDALQQTLQVGYELRHFWPLEALQEQVEHLDSIAGSLHMSADAYCESLLALAVEQIA